MLFNPRAQIIKRVQLSSPATVEPLRDPEPVKEPQVDVIHRLASIDSSARALERQIEPVIRSGVRQTTPRGDTR